MSTQHPSGPCTKPRARLRSKNRRSKGRRVTKRKFWSASETTPQDVYTRVTNKILDDLKRGTAPWVKPWKADNTEGRIIRPLRHNSIPYSGVNILLLWGSAMEQGFTSPHWMTFRQALELDAHVRKGEHGSLVVFAKTYQKTEHTAEGDVEKDIPFLKAYTVFNVEQIDGLPDQYRAKPLPKFENQIERIEHARQFFERTRANVITRGSQPLYSQASDHILMPTILAFKDAESYEATLAHELVHWTKHPARLAREFGRKTWGDAGYAAEELVAELGAAFLCADLEITPEVPEEHASYISTWLRVLMDDNRAVFTAASHAQKAVDYLYGLADPKPPTPSRNSSSEDSEPAGPAADDPGPGLDA